MPAVAEALAMVDRRRAGEAVELGTVILNLQARPDDEFFGSDLVVDESDLHGDASIARPGEVDASAAEPALSLEDDPLSTLPYGTQGIDLRDAAAAHAAAAGTTEQGGEPVDEATAPGLASPLAGMDSETQPLPSVAVSTEPMIRPRPGGDRDWSQDGLQTAEVKVAAPDPWFDDDADFGDAGDSDAADEGRSPRPDGFEPSPSARYRGVAPPPASHREATLRAAPGNPIFSTAPGQPGSGDWAAANDAPADPSPSAPADRAVPKRADEPTAQQVSVDHAATPLPMESGMLSRAAAQGNERPTEPVGESAGVEGMLQRIEMLLRRGDVASAMQLLQDAEATAPNDHRVLKVGRDVRSQLSVLRESRLEPLDRTPTANLEAVTQVTGLTPKMMFLLTQADGFASIRDLLDLSGLPRDQAAELVLELYDAGLLVDDA